MFASVTLRGTCTGFSSAAELLGRAGAPNAGDRRRQVAARDALERSAARLALAELELGRLREQPARAYEDDPITRLTQDTLDEAVWAGLAGLTVGGLREHLLVRSPADLEGLAPGLPPEVAAAVARLLSPLELLALCGRLERVGQAQATVGLRGTLAAVVRLEEGADLSGRAALALAWGAGDALLSAEGPAALTRGLDALEGLRPTCRAPVQLGAWAPWSAQLDALEAQAPLDVLCLPVSGADEGAGTQGWGSPGWGSPGWGSLGWGSPGLSVAELEEAAAAARELGRAPGPNRLVLEVDLGAGPTADGRTALDGLTAFSRACALSRRYRPLLLSCRLGERGPADLADAAEASRAALEALFVARLLGLPAGISLRAHPAGLDPEGLEQVCALLAQAGAGALEVGLSDPDRPGVHELAALREVAALQATPEMQRWAEERNLLRGPSPGPRLGEVGALTAPTGAPAR